MKKENLSRILISSAEGKKNGDQNSRGDIRVGRVAERKKTRAELSHDASSLSHGCLVARWRSGAEGLCGGDGGSDDGLV